MADRSYVYEPVSTEAPVKTQAHSMEQGQLWRQYIIAGVANIATIALGFALGWTSPVNLKLLDPNDTPLSRPVTNDEISWIGSLLSVGAMFGPFIGGFLASKIGRRWSILLSSVPLIVGFVLVVAVQNVAMIYAGRVFWGLAVGMLYTVLPMYCAEIATDDTRGALGSFLQLFVVLGFLLVYGVGPFVPYFTLQYVGIAVVAVFCVLFFFMPETPMYYLNQDDVDSAAKCLQIIRGKSRAGVQAELDKMAAEVKAANEKTANLSDVFRGANFKAFYISCALVAAQQLCGINAVLFYMATIFETAGASLDSAIATIIIGAVQVGASAVTPLVVDRLGRRMLLLISCTGTTIGLGLLGMYFILDTNGNPVVDSMRFLPILALVLFIVTYCVGLGPLPWAIMGELFPIEVKALASPIATAFCWMLSFLVTRYFNPIADAVGMGVAFLIFGVCCIIAFFFTFFMVPETKGKSFQEIQEMLAGKTSPSKSEKM
ncbi:facilitated trehalose transporter Tret1-2 homolog [Bombyx mandarina]|uniref:Facilitated trehalose transporter Tret1-2 homolog n=1 Tax=Bombyx mandarina TaxID=7092 RepID=A0A6J2JFX6_BOMMA|nr:facilitated trehalose transporter Tret1-2 homolog [Bombyx mandarina]